MKKIMNHLNSDIQIALQTARDSSGVRSNITRVIGTAGPIAEFSDSLGGAENAEGRPIIETFTKFLESSTKMSQNAVASTKVGNEALSTPR